MVYVILGRKAIIGMIYVNDLRVIRYCLKTAKLHAKAFLFLEQHGHFFVSGAS
jgi:hypothetical protein